MQQPGQKRTYAEFSLEVAHQVNGVSPRHGHTLVCRLDFVDSPDPHYGWPVNLYDVEKSFLEHVAKRIHPGDSDGNGIGEGDLSDIPEIGNASLENIAQWIWNIMKPLHPSLASVDLNRGFRSRIEGTICVG